MITPKLKINDQTFWFIDSSKNFFALNDIVSISDGSELLVSASSIDDGGLLTGIIQYLGDEDNDDIVGIRLIGNSVGKGNTDGTYHNGVKHFLCAPHDGMYVSRSKLTKYHLTERDRKRFKCELKKSKGIHYDVTTQEEAQASEKEHRQCDKQEEQQSLERKDEREAPKEESFESELNQLILVLNERSMKNAKVKEASKGIHYAQEEAQASEKEHRQCGNQEEQQSLEKAEEREAPQEESSELNQLREGDHLEELVLDGLVKEAEAKEAHLEKENRQQCDKQEEQKSLGREEKRNVVPQEESSELNQLIKGDLPEELVALNERSMKKELESIGIHYVIQEEALMEKVENRQCDKQEAQQSLEREELSEAPQEEESELNQLIEGDLSEEVVALNGRSMKKAKVKEETLSDGERYFKYGEQLPEEDSVNPWSVITGSYLEERQQALLDEDPVGIDSREEAPGPLREDDEYRMKEEESLRREIINLDLRGGVSTLKINKDEDFEKTATDPLLSFARSMVVKKSHRISDLEFTNLKQRKTIAGLSDELQAVREELKVKTEKVQSISMMKNRQLVELEKNLREMKWVVREKDNNIIDLLEITAKLKKELADAHTELILIRKEKTAGYNMVQEKQIDITISNNLSPTVKESSELGDNASLRLHRTWVIWHDNPRLAPKEGGWKDNLKNCGSFDSIPNFWRLYNNLKLASHLSKGSNYHIFAKGVMPMWEDPANRNGGKFVLTIPKEDSRAGRCDEWWMYTVLSMIGETIDLNGDDVCGAVVSIRKSQDRIALWLKNSSDKVLCSEIGARWKKALQLQKTPLTFQLHDDASASGRSFSNKVRFQV